MAPDAQRQPETAGSEPEPAKLQKTTSDVDAQPRLPQLSMRIITLTVIVSRAVHEYVRMQFSSLHCEHFTARVLASFRNDAVFPFRKWISIICIAISIMVVVVIGSGMRRNNKVMVRHA